MTTVIVIILGVAGLSLIVGASIGSSLATERNLDRSRRQAVRQRQINEDSARLLQDSARLAQQAVELDRLISEARRVLYSKELPDQSFHTDR